MAAPVAGSYRWRCPLARTLNVNIAAVRPWPAVLTMGVSSSLIFEVEYRLGLRRHVCEGVGTKLMILVFLLSSQCFICLGGTATHIRELSFLPASRVTIIQIQPMRFFICPSPSPLLAYGIPRDYSCLLAATSALKQKPRITHITDDVI
jgi:hypothetical protein